ncbi:MAG: hypothetical protein JRG96_15695, partial [Deltaproteobacteria bacterium]|nr:hypothetical protein [Deltaproteobacteria bacterium]
SARITWNQILIRILLPSKGREISEVNIEIDPASRSRVESRPRGEVLAVTGEDLNQKLKIKFERAGVKTVMVRYANLEPA